jgi:hypothetical protein
MQHTVSSADLPAATGNARHTDSEIEHAAQRFEQLVDTLAPATAQVEGTRRN